MRSTLVRSLVALLALPLMATAQEPAPLDSATLAAKSDAGVYLVHWAGQDGSRSEQTVFMKNISKDQRIRIDWWEVYECQNLAGTSCGRHEGGPIIKPGETVKLGNIRQGNRRLAYSYQYRFWASWVRDSVP